MSNGANETQPEPPTTTPDRDSHSVPSSLVLVNTGHGKGKSTAAFGTLLRSVALGWDVAVVQFLKGGKWQVGEEKVCRELGVTWLTAGDGFTWNSTDLDETEAKAVAAWKAAKQLILAGDHQLVVLDEISYALTWEWIAVDDVVATIEGRPANVSLILTGRDMVEPIIKVADTVTEMVNVKHAFDSGKAAKRGIDH